MNPYALCAVSADLRAYEAQQDAQQEREEAIDRAYDQLLAEYRSALAKRYPQLAADLGDKEPMQLTDPLIRAIGIGVRDQLEHLAHTEATRLVYEFRAQRRAA